MAVSGVLAQILQALRAGAIGASEAHARWPSGNISLLVSRGYVIRESIDEEGSVLRITELGRKACPSRNPLLDKVNAQLKFVTPQQLARKQPAESLVTISPIPAERLVTKKPISEKENNVTYLNDPTKKARTLQVLEFIEKNPNCITKDIVDHFDFDNPVSYIRKFVSENKVISTSVVGKQHRKAYKLAEGLTAINIYIGLSSEWPGEEKSIVDAQVDLSKIEPLVADEKTPVEEYEIPAFLTKAQADSNNVENPATLEQESTEAKQPDSDYRFALTSDNTLLLIGKPSIELNAQQTANLNNFLRLHGGALCITS